MKNEISALIDGELDPDTTERCLQGMKRDGNLLQAWHDYHLIGDALRGQIRPAIDAAFARRLEAEATVLAPRPIAANSSRWMPALSAVAGLAAIAFVAAAWVALPQSGMEAGSVAPALTASALAPSAPQPAAGSTGAAPGQSAPQQTRSGAGVPVAVGVEDYLLAHQRFSPANSMQGVAPYARTVSAERKGNAR